MKYIYLIVLFQLVSLHGKSQTCDIYTSGFAPVKQSYISGESVDLIFSIKNNTQGVACAYREKSVQVYLFLPERDLIFDKVLFPAGGKGAFFDWQYDEENKSLIGLNHTPIRDGEGEENIKVRIRVGKLASALSQKTVGLSIVQYHDGAVFPSNDQSNDNSIITLTLKPDVSQQSVQLAAINKDCNSAEIVFTCGEHGHSEKLEIQRTTDGKTYTKVGTLLPAKPDENDVVRLIDTDGLEPGQTYTYELTGWRADGVKEMLGMVVLQKECEGNQRDIEMYPNPATDKIYVRLTGALTEDRVDLIITNLRGEYVKTIEGVTNAQNEVLLAGLPSGVYLARIKGDETVSQKRIVKMEQ